MAEIWKDIEGYEGLYQVSNLGRVKSLDRIVITNNRWGGLTERNLKSRILKQTTDSLGRYLMVILSKDGVVKTKLVHRLVAKSFIQRDAIKFEVNHIDGNKRNNRLDNLEYCTRTENIKHAVETGLIENQCKIRRYVKISKDGETKEFTSMKDCASFFGFKKGWLHNRIRKHGNTFLFNDYKIEVGGRL